MKSFKFFQKENYYDYIRKRWVGVEVDGYKFRLYTHLSPYQINVELGHVYRSYMRMWDDDMNKERILELLKSRFRMAVNELEYETV